MKLQNKQKFSVFIVLIFISILIIIIQLFTSSDLFVSPEVSKNTKKPVQYITRQTFSNIKASIEIPSNFRSDCNNQPNQNETICTIENDAIIIKLEYYYIKDTSLGTIISGDSNRNELVSLRLNNETLTRGPLELITQEKPFYLRMKAIEDNSIYEYFYLDEKPGKEINEVENLNAYQVLPILQRGNIIGNGTKFTVKFKNNNIAEYTKYLQIADKVLLSIQSNE